MVKRGVVLLLCAVLSTFLVIPVVFAKAYPFEWQFWEHFSNTAAVAESNLSHSMNITAKIATFDWGENHDWRYARLDLYEFEELKASQPVATKAHGWTWSSSISAVANRIKQYGSTNWVKADFIEVGKEILKSSIDRELRQDKEIAKVSDVDFWWLSELETTLNAKSLNPGVKVWLSADSTAVLACLDTDKDGRCDYTQTQACDIKNGDWWEGRCCGVAPYDNCTFYEKVPGICGNNSQGDWEWAALSDSGTIHQLTKCPSLTLISDSNNYYYCGPDPNNYAQELAGTISERQAEIQAIRAEITSLEEELKTTYGKERDSLNKQIADLEDDLDELTKLKSFNITELDLMSIENHEFWCVDNKIYECAGDEGAFNDAGFVSGDDLVVNDTTYYCDGDGTFTISIKTRSACEAAGFVWTSTKCCGELDDPERDYQDTFIPGKGNAGGCYNNTYIASGEVLLDWPNIANYLGMFYVCDPELASEGESEFLTEKPAGYEDLPFIPTKLFGSCGTPLINATFVGNKPHLSCFPDSTWQLTGFEVNLTNKNTAWIVGADISYGCCPIDWCWNGGFCQEVGSYYAVKEVGYKCVLEE